MSLRPRSVRVAAFKAAALPIEKRWHLASLVVLGITLRHLFLRDNRDQAAALKAATLTERGLTFRTPLQTFDCRVLRNIRLGPDILPILVIFCNCNDLLIYEPYAGPHSLFLLFLKGVQVSSASAHSRPIWCTLTKAGSCNSCHKPVL